MIHTNDPYYQQKADYESVFQLFPKTRVISWTDLTFFEE